MADSKLVKYVQDQLKAGFSEEVIEDTLINAGYTASDARDAFSAATRPEPAKIPAEPPKKTIRTPPAPTTGKPSQIAGFDALIEILRKNWIFVIAIVVIAVAGILLASLFLRGGGGFAGVKNCGTETECMANAFASCSPATGTYSTSSSGSSLIFGGSVEGKSGDACIFQVEVKSATGTLSSYSGKSMKCTVALASTATFGDPLRDMTKIKPYCSGSLTSLVD